MVLKSVKTIRSLKRGLDVLRALEGQGAMSLDDLFARTKTPKATLSRILVTLQLEGLVSQRLADRKWVYGSGIGSGSRADIANNLLIQASSGELAELCQKVIWPSDLSMRSGLRMVLVETSRPHARLIFNKLSVGFEIDFLLSAPGRAYLAFCPDKERKDILDKLSKMPKYSFLFDSGQISHILDQVRAQGYGHRDSRWGGRGSEFTKTYDDGLDAIAVPIRSGNNVLGCVNIIWIRSILPRRIVVDRHLADLLETADRIAVAAVR